MKTMLILMYHDIVMRGDLSSGFQNDSAFKYKVEVGRFEEQVRSLANREKVVFTFDDGGVSFLTVAAPILEKYGLRGIFFISTKYLGTPGFLTREQVKELEARGHIIGSHSHSHPDNISSLNAERMDEEWQMSCEILKDILGHDISCASIPNGYGSKALYESAMKAGISELYTSVPTTKIRNQIRQTLHGRFVVHRDMSKEDVVSMVTECGKRQCMYLRWWVLELMKKVLGSGYDRVKALIIK